MGSDTPSPSEKDPLHQWHRAFGIALMDVFAGAPWAVGLENLRAHNLYNRMAHHRLVEGNMAHTYADMKREAREWLKGALSDMDPKKCSSATTPRTGSRAWSPQSGSRDCALRGAMIDPD